MFPHSILPIRIVSEPNLALAVCSVLDFKNEIIGVNICYRYPLSAEPKRMKEDLAQDVFGLEVSRGDNQKYQIFMRSVPEIHNFTLHNGKTLTYPFVADGKTGIVKEITIDIQDKNVYIQVHGEFKKSRLDTPIPLTHTIQAEENFVKSVRLWMEKQV